MNNLEKFLKKIGVNEAVVEKLTAEGEVNIEEIISQWKSNFKNVISNDPDFIQPIKDEIRGTELSKVEHKIKKQFGLSSDEVKDKKFDEIIAAAYEKVKISGNSTSEELQGKVMELSKENKRLMEEVIPAKESEIKEAIKGYQKETYIRNVLGSKPLIVKPDIAYLALQNHLNDSYSIDFEDNKPIVKTKNGLSPLNDEGTKTLSLEEIIDKKLMEDGLIMQSNGQQKSPVTQKTVKTAQLTEERKYNLPGIKSAEENAERMKNLRTFGQ
jgi:ribosomal protein S17E